MEYLILHKVLVWFLSPSRIKYLLKLPRIEQLGNETPKKPPQASSGEGLKLHHFIHLLLKRNP